jgi:hypothetical protein
MDLACGGMLVDGGSASFNRRVLSALEDIPLTACPADRQSRLFQEASYG